MRELTVNPKFQNSIPPLAEEEYRQLEENIVAEGCRDALVIWEGVILDGHNRYKICQEHGIDFKTVEMSFNSEEEAIGWILENQLGRRNLNPTQLRYLRGELYNRRKKIREDNIKTGKNYPKPQNEGSGTTAQAMAKEFGVGVTEYVL